MFSLPLDRLTNDPAFRRTSLYALLEKHPIGFIDVGAMGGVHQLAMPAAGLTSVLCFEPNAAERVKLEEQLAQSPFAAVEVAPYAIADHNGTADFHITRNTVTSSLRRVDPWFLERYRIKHFDVVETVAVPVRTLDELVMRPPSAARRGELVKIDAQGMGYEVLAGAKTLLGEQCLAVLCEAEFVDHYESEKKFPEIHGVLSSHGFYPYGFFPHYHSNKMIDRLKLRTQERLLCADVLYFKDPLERGNSGWRPDAREQALLTVFALCAGYFDYAMELAARFYAGQPDHGLLTQCVENLATVDQEDLVEQAAELSRQCQRDPSRAYYYVSAFIERHAEHADHRFLFKQMPQA